MSSLHKAPDGRLSFVLSGHQTKCTKIIKVWRIVLNIVPLFGFVLLSEEAHRV